MTSTKNARPLSPRFNPQLRCAHPSSIEDASSQTVCYSGRGNAAPEVPANEHELRGVPRLRAAGG